MGKSGADRIIIKKRGRYHKGVFKVLFSLMLTVSIAVITSNIVINNALRDKSEESSCNDIDEVFSKGITKISHSLVTISESSEKLGVNTVEEGNVTGLVINKKGYIVTSLSEVKNMKKIFVKLPALAKEPIEGKILGVDKNTNIALIKVNSEGLVPAVINEEPVSEGKIVIAAGNSISNDFIGMVTVGAVTSSNIQNYNEENNNLYELIQTSAIVNDDNIGGPLCNINGEVIGFNSFIYNKENLYNSLSVKQLKKVVEYIISFTDKFGINVDVIDDRENGVRGLYIEDVIPGGYASKAGMLPTDIILKLNDISIESLEDINDIIENRQEGEIIKCEILRDGVKSIVEIPYD